MGYPNLIAEMARSDVKVKDIANEIGCTPDTVRNWLKGKSPFPVDEAIKVQEKYFPGCTLIYLFKNEPIVPTCDK